MIISYTTGVYNHFHIGHLALALLWQMNLIWTEYVMVNPNI